MEIHEADFTKPNTPIDVKSKNLIDDDVERISIKEVCKFLNKTSKTICNWEAKSGIMGTLGISDEGPHALRVFSVEWLLETLKKKDLNYNWIEQKEYRSFIPSGKNNIWSVDKEGSSTSMMLQDDGLIPQSFIEYLDKKFDELSIQGTDKRPAPELSRKTLIKSFSVGGVILGLLVVASVWLIVDTLTSQHEDTMTQYNNKNNEWIKAQAKNTTQFESMIENEKTQHKKELTATIKAHKEALNKAEIRQEQELQDALKKLIAKQIENMPSTEEE